MKGYKKKKQETTEWEDSLIKHKVGLFADYDPESNYEWVEGTETEEENMRKLRDFKLGNASLEKLDEYEDQEEEKVLEEYRKKRLAELKKKSEESKFGQLFTISAKDWENEVTNPSKETFVVVFLYKPKVKGCRIVDEALGDLSHKFKNIKFVKVLSTDAIPNWPDKFLPAFLCYKDTEPKHQIIGLDALGGEELTSDNLEWALYKKQILKTELKMDPRFKNQKNKFREEVEEDEDDIYDVNHSKLNYVGRGGLFQDVEELEEHFNNF